MATEAFDSNQVQRYSIRPRRSHAANLCRERLAGHRAHGV